MLLRMFNKLKRSLEYAIHGYNSYDWDDGYIDKDLLFKLKRVYKQLQKDSSFVQYEKTDLQSLKIAIKVLERLTAEDFTVNTCLLEEKWGEFKTVSLPDGSFKITRDKVFTENDAQLCRQDSAKAYLADDLHEQRYRKLFYAILLKYKHRWWS